jgi:hypothetical protein
MDSSRVSKVSDFVGRIALIVLFGTMAITQTLAVIRLFGEPGGPQFLDLAIHLATIAYVVLVVGLTVVRIEPIRNAEGFEPRLSALAGTFLFIAWSRCRWRTSGRGCA